MRILTVIQRFGADITGGAEANCRALVRGLTERGHLVEVLTTSSTEYGDWANVLPRGMQLEEGVPVHRLDTGARLDRATFEPLDQRVIGALLLGSQLPRFAQEEWLRALGPTMPGLASWIDANVDRFDIICVHTLAYAHAAMTVAAVDGRRPVVLHPLAHDEPALALDVYNSVLERVNAFAFLTDEEAAIIDRRCSPRPSAVIGLGIEPPQVKTVSAEAVRDRLGLRSGEVFLVCVGRVDREKGVHSLAGWIRSLRRRGVELAPLVVIGDVMHPLESDDSVRVVGRLDPADVVAAMREAVVLVHPSRNESFGIVLCEAWAQGTPCLVNAGCDVTVGQCERSGGGIAWRDIAELAAQVDAFTADPALRSAFGERGRRYVIDRLRWSGVLDRYEALLNAVVGAS